MMTEIRPGEGWVVVSTFTVPVQVTYGRIAAPTTGGPFPDTKITPIWKPVTG